MNLNNGAVICRCCTYVDYPVYHSKFHLGGSVNGLVCVYHYDHHVGSIPRVGIWNPATDHFKDIPIPPSARSTCIGLYSTIVQERPYWYNDYNRHDDYNRKYYVMFFDVQEEVFRLLRDIGLAKKPKKQKIMVNFRDSLAFIYYNAFFWRSMDVYIFNERRS
ncbi:hypothetical protein POM88_027839 [Heracleum sosnowskyi]|uniref:F-box associated domain-containing protein n=1 Tax=Heracleum sosnowskyi TaxID=360622 RepID=A0AAD8I936_9APIA|nr:hypothetical protein POM88_027839 [Heracleum sosnowskyi]